MKLLYTENKELKSRNNVTIPAKTLKFYCSTTATIKEGAYICSDCKISDNALIGVGTYLGTRVIIRKDVKVPDGSIVSATSGNKIHNKTAEQVEEYFKD